MLQRDKEYHVRVTGEEFRRLLLARITGPHAEKIVEVILGHVDRQDLFVSQTIQAMNGILPSCKVKVGEEVMVKADAISSYRMNLEKMQEQKMLHQGYIKGVVQEINLYASYPIVVSYQFFPKIGSDLQTDKGSVKDDYVVPAESYPFDERPDDLPF